MGIHLFQFQFSFFFFLQNDTLNGVKTLTKCRQNDKRIHTKNLYKPGPKKCLANMFIAYKMVNVNFFYNFLACDGPQIQKLL